MAPGNRLIAALGGLIAPVGYSSRVAYRQPPALYRHLQWLGWLLTSHGWVPDCVVVLEVLGRRSGRLRRTVLVRTAHGVGPATAPMQARPARPASPESESPK